MLLAAAAIAGCAADRVQHRVSLKHVVWQEPAANTDTTSSSAWLRLI
ncbi:hypothetical protein [Variovorax sp. PBL-E5]|nr:hypothetical protein [Variovorax sp. PBL-E5]